ncbi:M56 family metallopeptidase [Mitsuaria sp. GD03876]|uniref:M56 family metallopeptidase n=1 Tax=Mitsuaria sp. GD03876 TaxID=2975399 RepID=UPI00244CA59C|nr:M56 family metallopeptidase [Mitsuaria sp. GD03876]MDH0864093.1 M48 family metalloprotease [Mitsuaria sp. GD03876]
MIEALTGWLLNYLVHSTVLLGGVWALERAGVLKHPAWREALWRWAFFGAVLTASVQPLTQGTRIAVPDVWATARTGASALGILADETRSGDDAVIDGEQGATASSGADRSNGASGWRASTGADGSAAHLEKVREAGASGDIPSTPATARAPSPYVLTEDHIGDSSDDALERRRALLRDALAALLLSWPVVSAIGLGLTMLRWLALRRQVRALPVFEDDELRLAAAELARNAGVRTPTLRLSPAWPSPLVAPGGQVCLPATLMRTLDGQQRVAVLAHEIAHLRRRDLAWRLAARLVSQLGWLQPMNRLAMRRLDLLAELACDAWAAAEAGAMPLAESLYVCARDGAAASTGARRATRPMPVLASAMAAARSPLMARMDALLEETPMSDSTPGRRRLRRVLLAGGLCAVALAVPMLVIGKAPRIAVDLSDVRGAMSSALSSVKVTRQIMISEGLERRVNYSGDLVFNDDETDVVSLDDKLSILEKTGGVTRKLDIVADGKGGQTRRFWVDGESKPIDGPARAWIAGQIGQIAESANGSGARVQRVLQRGGVEAAIEDIGQARDAMVRRGRIEALLASGPQDDATMSRLIALAGRMEDDFQRRSTFIALIEHRPLSPTTQRELLELVPNLNSDFDRREVMVAMSPQLANDRAVLAAWQQAVRRFGSDFDKRTAIVALIDEDHEATPERLRTALAASGMVGGDFDRRSVLEVAARRMGGDAASYAAAYVDAVRGISGDFDRRSALVALMDEVKIDREVAQQVLRATGGMSAGFDRAELLIALAEHLPADADLLVQYRQAARGLGTHDRGRVEAAIDHLMPS